MPEGRKGSDIADLQLPGIAEHAQHIYPSCGSWTIPQDKVAMQIQDLLYTQHVFVNTCCVASFASVFLLLLLPKYSCALLNIYIFPSISCWLCVWKLEQKEKRVAVEWSITRDEVR